MGCGCNKKGVTGKRLPNLRPTIGPRSIPTNAPTPTELRAIGLQKAVSLADSRTMDAQRRRIEQLRREAIKRAFNK